MTMSEIWEPTEDDVNWTRHELEGIEIGGTWSRGECLFLRAEERALTVLSVQERAVPVIDRVESVLNAMEWTMNKEGMQIVPADPAQQMAMVCHECDGAVNIAPIDYGLIAGDELFYTVNLYEGVTLRVMAREEIIEMVDNEGDEGFIVGSHFINALDEKHDIPPHIQGSYVQLVRHDEEEE